MTSDEDPFPGGARPTKTLHRFYVAILAALALLLLGHPPSSLANPAGLSIEFDGQKRELSAIELLANPATRALEIPKDVAYGRPMRYRAIPLLELLRGMSSGSMDTIEARATDGFVSQLPWSLVERAVSGGAVAWIAIEDPAHPWPKLPDKPVSAGPFYLVWEHPERSGITAEQWPYALASLADVSDPLQRWPQLSLDDAVPPDAPSRRGQAVFLAQCLPCHRLYGAGAGEQGPDLGRPMAAIDYMTRAGLEALLRNPAAVRSWPQQQMPAFGPNALPDADINAVIAYLAQIAEQQR